MFGLNVLMSYESHLLIITLFITQQFNYNFTSFVAGEMREMYTPL